MNGRSMKGIIGTLLLFTWLLALPLNGAACVGKTLVVGYKGTVQQEVLAQLLSLLISERTGTTVKVKAFDSTAEIHQALLKADLDMYVEYTGVGQLEVLGGETVADPEALYQAVKESYNQQLNLVWLKPLGFDEPSATAGAAPAQAAPVVRKDTLKKFPALARLINKLGGAVDASAIAALEQEAQAGDAAAAARRFLKSNRFI